MAVTVTVKMDIEFSSGGVLERFWVEGFLGVSAKSVLGVLIWGEFWIRSYEKAAMAEEE